MNFRTIMATLLAALTALSLLSCKKAANENISGSVSENADAPYGEAAVTTFGDLPAIPSVEYPDSAQSSDSTASNEHENTAFLEGGSIVFSGSGAHADGSVLTVTSAGSYYITGRLDNGQIIVNTEDEEKVELILDGADIRCSYSAPIYVISAPKKVEIHLAEGSVNIVCDGESYQALYEDDPTAAIYSKADLEIEGGGELYVTGNYNKGIYGKDDLEIKSGSIFVTATDDAIRGKDSLVISGGKVTVASGADGLRSNNTEDAQKGIISISGGEIYVTSDTDGIQSDNVFEMSGGSLVIKAGGGNDKSSTSGGNNDFWGGMWPGMGGNNGNSSSDPTNHGIKAENSINISGGTIAVDCSDDAFHSGVSMHVSNGSIHASAGDDGLHAENTLDISGGSIYIEDSYEGFEAMQITVSGGTNVTHSRDDGMNAAGGSVSTGGMPGSNAASQTCLLTFSGGYNVVYADGDGIDSNGNIVMTDGTVLVFGPTNSGNGAIDYGDGGCNMTISSGTLLAVGSSGMADCATGNGQNVIFASTGNIQANTPIAIADSEGNILFLFENPKLIQTIVFSSPELEKNSEYSVYSGGSVNAEPVYNVYPEGNYTSGSLVTTVTASESPASSGGMGGGMGGGPGGGMGGGPGGRPR